MNYIAQMDHAEFDNASLVYRSGPFNIGEIMSDYDEFDTLGPLPPRDDGNQEHLSESGRLDQRKHLAFSTKLGSRPSLKF